MFQRLAHYLMLASVVFTFTCLNASAQPPPATGVAQAAPPSSAPPLDRVQQMRADLNQMESLMNNMSSEINFLRDQNLQILLNTNVRMWTILIRDLRQQLDDEQRKYDRGLKNQKPVSHP